MSGSPLTPILWTWQAVPSVPETCGRGSDVTEALATAGLLADDVA